MTPPRPLLLTLRALGLGDLLCAVPAVRALASAFPEHHRVLAAPAPLAPLAALTGAVDATVPTPALAPLPPALRGADVAVNLHGRGPQSHRVLLDAAPTRLVAFAHPAVPATAGAPVWDDGEHEVARWCRLLDHHGIGADPGDLDLPAPDVAAPAWAQGATLIHPGAGSPARRWPPERFAAVARAEAGSGRRVVITAGPGERELARAVLRTAAEAPVGAPPAAEAPGFVTVAQPDDVIALAALVAAAGRVVCGDTGVAHLATALGTPSVVLFGPTSPARWGPPADRPSHRVLWAGTTGPAHGPEPDRGLLAIGVGDVLGALGELDALHRQAAV